MRLPNWDVELVRYCDALRREPRAYGFVDCVLIAAGAVEVQTGRELTREHAGKYHDEASARAYMAANGWQDVDDVVDSFLPGVDVRTRRRGDILLFRGAFGKTLGICLGREALVLRDDGAMQVLSSLAVKAWRVD